MNATKAITIVLLALCIILAACICGYRVSAIDNETISNISYIDAKIVYPYSNEILRIPQGADVFVNETIDISGMGWGNGVAWYGPSGLSETPLYVREFAQSKIDVIKFYVDPEIFLSRPGMWYQYYGSNAERHGNLDAFNVKSGLRNSTMRYSNGTLVNLSVGNLTNEKQVVIKKPLLPEIRVSDYAVAKGNELFINTSEDSKVWIFGTEDKIYDIKTYGRSAIINKTSINNLKTGNYKVLIQSAGKNTIYEASFENDQFVSPWAKVDPISVYGSQPKLDITKLKEMLDKTDDKYEIYNLEVQDPSISIVSIDEQAIGSQTRGYLLEDGLVTLLNIKGYSNLIEGSDITVCFDKSKYNAVDIKKYTYHTKVERNGSSYLGAYQAFIPMVWNDISTGVHTISAEDEFGTIVLSDVPISPMPEDSFRPNGTLKYIDSRNPWVPTPTPEIVKVIETKIVKETVIVKVTPSNEQVLEQQSIATNEAIKYWVINLVIVLITLIVIGIVSMYLLSVYRRI